MDFNEIFGDSYEIATKLNNTLLRLIAYCCLLLLMGCIPISGIMNSYAFFLSLGMCYKPAPAWVVSLC